MGVDPSGWAKFGHVKMPDYRWGILLAPKEEGRTIPCGSHKGEPAWLSFFMFTYFTDRDGKMQLAALAQSGFDPLSRSCRFMLTEEAHHLFVVDGKFVTEDVPALRAINSRLLDDYIADCQGGIERWNKSIEKAGIAFSFSQPHKGFNRKIGEFATAAISPAGELLSADAWDASKGDWLCNDEDHAYINSLMKPCVEPFEYVRIEHS